MTILLLELLLSTVGDIGGVYATSQRVHWFLSHKEPHPTGYAFTPGVYDDAMGHVTITPDGIRAIPNVTTARCSVALVGDSFTFGWGLDDDETFAYHLSRMLPEVRIINTGRPAYNSTNLTRVVDYHDADGYVYLAIGDDNEAPAVYTPPPGKMPAALTIIVTRLIMPVQAPPPPDYALYIDVLTELERAGVVFVALEHSALPELIAGWGFDVHTIEMTGILSPSDGHPSAEAALDMAHQLAPIVRGAAQNCLDNERREGR
jgi:hypothetical protein